MKIPNFSKRYCLQALTLLLKARNSWKHFFFSSSFFFISYCEYRYRGKYIIYPGVQFLFLTWKYFADVLSPSSLSWLVTSAICVIREAMLNSIHTFSYAPDAMPENMETSCSMTKSTKWPVHPAKTQISLGSHPIWSESSLSARR